MTTESDNIYDNLDNCLEILYQCAYKKDICYRLEPKLFENITINDLKKNENFDYTDIFNKKIKFIRTYTNNKYEFKRYNNENVCLITISKCDDENLNDINRKEIHDVLTRYLLSDLVINEDVKHVLLTVMCFDMKKKDIEKIEELDKHIDNKSKIMNVRIDEHFYMMKTLREYLDENINKFDQHDVQVLLFQIYYTLSKITERLRKFIHNNLNLDTIKVYVKKMNNDTIIYNLTGTKYNIQNRGFEIKLTSFEHSVYEINNNTNLLDNPFIDIVVITNIIINYIKEKNYELYKKIYSFYDNLIIDKFKNIITYTNEEITSNYITTPSTILKKNNFFSDLIMNKETLSISPLQNRRININELKNTKNTRNTRNNKKIKSRGIYINMITGKRKVKYGTDSEVNEHITHAPRASNINPLETSISEGGKKSESSKSSKSSKSSSKYDKYLKKTSSSSDSSKSDKSEKSEISSSTITDSSVLSGGRKHKKHSKKRNHLEKVLTEKDRNILNNLPDNYLDVAPEHLINKLSMAEGSAQNAQMQPMQGMSPPQMQMQAPMQPLMQAPMQEMQAPAQGLTPQEMTQLQSMTSYPPMPQGMGQTGQMNAEQMNMGAMQNSNQMASFMGMQPTSAGLGVPMMGQDMMNNGMGQFGQTGGAGQNENSSTNKDKKVYKFNFDILKLIEERKKNGNKFFF